MRPRHKTLLVAGVFLAFAGACLSLVSGFRTDRLKVVSCDPDISITSIVCTVGTNHLYYYGDLVDRILDPITTRFGNAEAYRLRCETSASNTVIWIRFEHPDFGIPPPMGLGPPVPFQVVWIDTNGARIPLNTLNPRLQSFRGRFLVLPWEFPGLLEAHGGGTIQIQATNGATSATLQIR